MGRVDRQSLVNEYMGLVHRIAARVHRSLRAHLEIDDLVALGTQGLIEAAARYQACSGTPFPAFANRRIRGAMYDGLRKMTSRPRIRARPAEPEREAPRGPIAATQEDLPDAVAERPADAGALHALAMVVISAFGADPSQEAMLDPYAAPADELLVHKHMASALGSAIAALPDPERYIVRRCYFDGTTMCEAGAELGLSRSWSSRLHARAMARLRNHLRHALGEPL